MIECISSKLTSAVISASLVVRLNLAAIRTPLIFWKNTRKFKKITHMMMDTAVRRHFIFSYHHLLYFLFKFKYYSASSTALVFREGTRNEADFVYINVFTPLS